jgi:predicted glycoside hydrolase/deacetylase ChbG (UPF0249 family)
MKKMKRLIVNADDFGMSAKFNKGILELVEKGIVTSTTVMIKRKFAESKDLLRHQFVSIGLHLELSLETPEKEIDGQVKKFKKTFGWLPSHLDGHKYYHLLPGNFSKVLRIAKKYNLPVRSTSSADRLMLKKYGVKTPDNFISWHPNRKEKMFRELGRVKRGTIELLCHPGYFDRKSKSSYNKQREKELRILKSGVFQDIIRTFDLITYEQI